MNRDIPIVDACNHISRKKDEQRNNGLFGSIFKVNTYVINYIVLSNYIVLINYLVESDICASNT